MPAAARKATAPADAGEALGRELFEAGCLGLARLDDPQACEQLLRSRRMHRLDLNAVVEGRREAIRLTQRGLRSHAARLDACRHALKLLEAALGDEAGDDLRRAVSLARDAFAGALAPRRAER